MMSGSDVQYTNPFTGGVLLFTSEGFPRIEASITLTAMPMPDWRWRLAAAFTVADPET
jgi:hypothetical protein